MAIIRVIKDKSNPYVMLNKTCLRDEKLSWKAKGLHSYLLSLPDDWQIYIEDLKNRSKDGKEATSTAIKELINAGYVKRIAKRDSKTNRFIGGFEYEVYEMPIDIVDLPKDGKSRESEKPETGKSDNRENREPGNPSLLNNKLKLKLNNNIYSLVIEKLNDLANTSYKATTKKTRSLIRSRVEEGFTVEDFYKVIEIKVSDWKGTEFEKYIRPETLFGSKFENYLNQKVKPKQEKTINEDTDFYPNMDFETI